MGFLAKLSDERRPLGAFRNGTRRSRCGDSGGFVCNRSTGKRAGFGNCGFATGRDLSASMSACSGVQPTLSDITEEGDSGGLRGSAKLDDDFPSTAGDG